LSFPALRCAWLSIKYQRYTIALALAKTLGGRKFHNKQYGGGIVFQEYDGCLPQLCDRINALTSEEVAA
jgi:hypothetical protein